MGPYPDTVSPQDGARGDGNASDSSGELDGQSALPPAWSASCGQRGGFQVTTLSSMMGSPTLASNESDSHVLFMLGSYLGLFHWHQDATGAVTTHTNKLGVNVGLNPFATLDQSGLLHASAFNNDGLIYLHRAANGTWSHELLHRATLYKSSSAIAVDQSGEVVILMPERRAPFRILMFSKKAGSASWKHQTFASSDSPAFVALATSATRDTVYASYRKLDSAAKTQSVHFAIRDTTGAFRHETVYQQHTLSATPSDHTRSPWPLTNVPSAAVPSAAVPSAAVPSAAVPACTRDPSPDGRARAGTISLGTGTISLGTGTIGPSSPRGNFVTQPLAQHQASALPVQRCPTFPRQSLG
jgi:hypothetical protein